MSKKKVGLFFGSFDPFHIGHVLVSRYAYELCNLDEIWFVVSPVNPFKKENIIQDFKHRYKMIKKCCKRLNQDKEIYRVSDMEEYLDKPSYTADTLKELKKVNKDSVFHLVFGEDILKNLDQWKDYKYIVNTFPIIVYPRLGGQLYERKDFTFKTLKAPILEISSTEIKKRIMDNKDVSLMLPESVLSYIQKRKLYGYQNNFHLKGGKKKQH